MKNYKVLAVLWIEALICGSSDAVGDTATFVTSDDPLKNNDQDRLQNGNSLEESSSIVPIPPVGEFNIEDLPEELQPHKEKPSLLSTHEDLTLRHAPSGRFPNLVLLLLFADHASYEHLLPAQEDIASLYNSEDVQIDETSFLDRNNSNAAAPTGSVRQVYYVNSHTSLTIDTTVVGWIPLSQNQSYYADGKHGLGQSKFREAMEEALTYLETEISAEFDFVSFDQDENGSLDGFGVLHSGYAAEFGEEDANGIAARDRIWSHKGGMDWTSSSGEIQVQRYYVSSALRGKRNYNICRIGVLCHELGHYIGLPDLYDPTFQGNGLGAYDFMSESWGFRGGGLYPPNLSAYSKLQLGWATAELIEEDGEYELKTSISSEPYVVHKITHGFPDGEYLLLENRQPVGFDSVMPGVGGIAIYHVDENMRGQRERGCPSVPGWPENGEHYRVTLVEADGDYGLEDGTDIGNDGDLWHSGSILTELRPGSGQFPNTDSYQNGIIEGTGIRIFNFSVSELTMTYQVEIFPEQTVTDSPTHSPTETFEPTADDLSSNLVDSPGMPKNHFDGKHEEEDITSVGRK